MNDTIDSGIFFTINEVAKQVGVVPATIRNWEKAGLITIRRSSNGYRIFDLQDIAFLKKLKHKSKDENFGINGLKLLCQDKCATGIPQTRSAPEPFQQNVSKRLLGAKWREYRLKRGYNLEDVANSVGISASYLSKIENEQANVSYEVLQKVAEFYGENLLFYLTDTEESSNLVKKGSAESFEIGIPGLRVESVIALRNHTMSALIYTAEPGSGHIQNSAHNGEEFIHIITGKIEFVLNDTEKYMLSAGDSMCFNSAISHRWRNMGSRTAKFLWVYTPLVKL